MMTKAAITSLIALLLAAGASASVPTKALAVSLAVSPTTISNEFEGKITLTITNLTAGQTVRVDKIADLNGNGGVDAGEPIVQSFTVTDGQVLTIGGQRNVNVPEDKDSVAGQITAKVFYPGTEATIDHIAGTYLYRVSDPTSGLQLATSPLTISQNTSLPQGVTGTITEADNGHPLANIPVALPDMQGKGGVGAFTDANGNYTVFSAPGSSYVVVPVAPGFVVDMEASSVTVNAGQFTVKNVALARGNFTVSGSVSDSAPSGAGIPGVFMMGQMGEDCPQCLFAGSFTDSSGNYTLSVNSGQWKIRVDESDPAITAGYVGPPGGVSLDITGSVYNVDFALPKATALIYGTVQDDQGNPVIGVALSAEDQNGNQRAGGRAVGSNGDYALGVVPGSWNVGVDSDELSSLGYAGGQWVTVNVTYDQALLQNFTVQRITAYLQGRLVDTENNGVANVGVSACLSQGGSCTDSQTGADGSFSVGVYQGGWNLSFSSDDLASRGLVGPQFQFTVTQGVNQTVNNAVALPAPRRISGFVRDANGNAIGSLWVYAFATINDRQYNAGGQTDDQGNYTLAVADGDWQVGLNCYGSNSLSSYGLPCVSNQSVHISQNNGTADFVVGTPAVTCVGDCGNDGQVTVDEILTLVNIALRNLDVSHCLAGDANDDNQITIDEILRAVNNALNGC
jgi:hypothetical protein